MTPGSGSFAVSWTAPPQPSRSPLRDYTIQWSADNGTTWNTVSDGTALTTSATITGLTPGVPHLVRVAAINEYGAGAPVVTASPVAPQATAPAAPAAPTVIAGDRQVTLSWTAPADNGSAITGYSIEYSVDGGASQVTWNPSPATATSATETGLVNGTSYIFRVVASNAVGTGTASAWSAQATPSNAVPGAPTGLSATPTSGGTSLTWTEPAAAADPAAALTDYFVEVTADGGATWTAHPRPASTTTTTSLMGLAFGASYLFRVSAVNQFGRSLPSAVSAATSPLATAPAAPGDVSATAATGGVTLTWAPSADNGSPVTDYLVHSSSDGGVTWTSFSKPVSTATTTTVTGHVNGRTYVFQVRGLNGVGSGPWSATTQPVVLTATVPAVVTGLSATPQSGAVALSWTAPTDNGGVAITDYVIDVSTDGLTWWRHADGTSTTASATVAGLPGGVGYFFRVAARNPLGEGPAATTSDAVTTLATVPTAPKRPMVTAGNGQVAVEWWTSPSDNGS
ncbi:MAG: fibronectin type III domain-containing protein, partial [Pirellulales bacterium]